MSEVKTENPRGKIILVLGALIVAVLLLVSMWNATGPTEVELDYDRAVLSSGVPKDVADDWVQEACRALENGWPPNMVERVIATRAANQTAAAGLGELEQEVNGSRAEELVKAGASVHCPRTAEQLGW